MRLDATRTNICTIHARIIYKIVYKITTDNTNSPTITTIITKEYVKHIYKSFRVPLNVTYNPFSKNDYKPFWKMCSNPFG